MQALFRHSQIEGSERLAYDAAMPLTLHIRELRKARGLTLAQLADMVHISIPHMSEVERGKKNLNNHLLTRISEALLVKPEDLLSGTSNEHADLLAAMKRLSDADRQRVEDFAAALLSSQKGAAQAE